MRKTLIIVRHGNTFLPDQTPTRVGRGTDLPLIEEKRGRAVGRYLSAEGYSLSKVFAAPLQRTMQTAQLVLDAMKSKLPIITEKRFSEVDYGADENKTEEQVMFRLGKSYCLHNNISALSDEQILEQGKRIIEQWDADGTVPNGWLVDTGAIIESWKYFSGSIADGETVLLCSSNGIIRFAPHILDIPYIHFCNTYDIKVATGSVSIFEYKGGGWRCKEWNTKPYNLF